MKYTVDRIEGSYAVLESEASEFIQVSVSDLPVGIRDGSVLDYNNNIYVIDTDSEMQRRRALYEKQQKLLNRKK